MVHTPRSKYQPVEAVYNQNILELFYANAFQCVIFIPFVYVTDINFRNSQLEFVKLELWNWSDERYNQFWLLNGSMFHSVRRLQMFIGITKCANTVITPLLCLMEISVVLQLLINAPSSTMENKRHFYESERCIIKRRRKKYVFRCDDNNTLIEST